ALEARYVIQRSHSLNFARFVSVPENRSGLLAARRVAACVGARRRKRVLNPLYLHGPSGTGKTHLVSALVGEAVRRAPDLVVTLIPAGDFASLAGSSEDPAGNGSGALEAARQGDLLIVEDLQYLPARAAGAFGQLVDDLRARQIQMVFTASTGPGGLDLPARLTSRLAGGLVVGLEPLPAAGRLALLEARARQR